VVFVGNGDTIFSPSGVYTNAKCVAVPFPEDLAEPVEGVADEAQKSLRRYLNEMRTGNPLHETVVDLYLDGTVAFDTLVEIVGHQDAEVVRASKKLLDDGETLADELADL